MKYYFALLAFTFVYLSGFSQQITYSQWKEEAKNNMALIPKYGNLPKTEQQKDADAILVKTFLEQHETHRKSSETLVKMGFNYLHRGDLETAMYRFNQAFLLDPTNEDVFWGFGRIYFTFGDYEAANKQYNEGLAINPKSSNIITDIASIHMAIYENTKNEKELDKAIEIFKKAYAIDSENQNVLFKLSAAYFYKNDCANAWIFHDKCKKLGGKPLTADYTKALTAKCNR
ncbi:tetratricopeptide repeat protein [Pedobacter frigiditerrae]|uniref:tetratricopeptide repeat protein n=1 Tax=Pedobacter frigiditerrae TaxID=2530452 RepID=UPI00293117CD|nr:tetratricopeptide repeat protein [Pedobacter frigiditerrae]